MPNRVDHFFLFVLFDQLKPLMVKEKLGVNDIKNLGVLLERKGLSSSWSNFVRLFGRVNDTKGGRKAPIRYTTIRKLFDTFAIDREKFLLSPEEEKDFFKDFGSKSTWKQNLFFTNSKWQEIINQPESIHNESLLDVSPALSHDLTNNTHYAEEYLKIVEAYFRNVKNSIRVFEVLFKGDNTNPEKRMNQYRIAHENIFKIIYSKLEANDNNFQYTRIYSVDFSETLIPKTNAEDIQISALLEMSNYSFSHLIRCIFNHKEKVSFRVRRFERFRHYCIFDDEFVIFEDYVKNDSLITPELLSIFSISSDSRMNKPVKEVYSQVFNDENSFLFESKNIERILNKTNNFIKDKIKLFEQMIDTAQKLTDHSEFSYFDKEIAKFENLLSTCYLQKRKIESMFFVYQQAKDVVINSPLRI